MRQLILSLIIPFSFYVSAQAPEIQWQKTFGGNLYDSCANTIPVDDGYLFFGKSESGISGEKTSLTKGGQDIWIVKTDLSGNILWQKAFGGSGNDSPYPFVKTSDGGYLIGCDSDSNISGDKTENTHGFNDIWLIKFDADFNIEWQNTIGAAFEDIARSIIQTSDGGYLIAADSVSNHSDDKSEDNVGFPFGVPYYTYYDYWIIKISALGNIEWDNTIGSKDRDSLNQIVNATDGGYLVAGESYCDPTGDYIGTGNGLFDCWLVKLDLTGNIVWQKTIGGNGNDYLQKMLITDDGGYVLGLISNSGISGDKTENSKGGDDFWIVKTDADGNVEWDKTIGGAGTDWLYSIEKDPDGNLYFEGPSNSNISGDKTQNSRGGNDFWLVKADSNADVIWDKTIGGSLDDYGVMQYLPADNSIIIYGQSASPISGDKTESSRGQQDYWIVKLEPENLALKSFSNSGLCLYPNPTSGNIAITFPEVTTAGISVSNVRPGRKHAKSKRDKSANRNQG